MPKRRLLTEKQPVDGREHSDEIVFRTYVTTHAVLRGRKNGTARVDVIGAPHATLWQTQNPIVRDHLRTLARKEAVVASEIVDKGMLPQSLLSRARQLEPSVIRRALVMANLNGFSVGERRKLKKKLEADDKIIQGVLKEGRRYGRFKGEIVRDAHPRMPRDLSERLMFEERTAKAMARGFELSPQARFELGGLVSGVRSFLMTGRVFKLARTHDHVQAIVGSGHSGHVARFLENPELYRRYGEKAFRELDRAPEGLRFLKPYVREALAQAPSA